MDSPHLSHHVQQQSFPKRPCSGRDDDNTKTELSESTGASGDALDIGEVDSISGANKIGGIDDIDSDRLEERTVPLPLPSTDAATASACTYSVHRCEVRELSNFQVAALLAIEIDHGNGGYHRNGDSLACILRNQPALHVCIASETQADGCIQCLGFALADCAIFSFLWELHVIPSHRQLGIGRDLLLMLIGYGACSLQMHSNNADASRFYNSNGFELDYDQSGVTTGIKAYTRSKQPIRSRLPTFPTSVRRVSKPPPPLMHPPSEDDASLPPLMYPSSEDDAFWCTMHPCARPSSITIPMESSIDRSAQPLPSRSAQPSPSGSESSCSDLACQFSSRIDTSSTNRVASFGTASHRGRQSSTGLPVRYTPLERSAPSPSGSEASSSDFGSSQSSSFRPIMSRLF